MLFLFKCRVFLRQILTPIVLIILNLSFYVYNTYCVIFRSFPKSFFITKIINKMSPLNVSLKETRLLLAEMVAHISISREDQYAMSSPWVPDQLVMSGKSYEYSLDGENIYLDNEYHSHIDNNINADLSTSPDYYADPLNCGDFTKNIMAILEKNSKFGTSAKTNCSDTLISASSYKDGLYYLSIPVELPEEMHPILLQAAQIEFIKCKIANINITKPRYMYLSSQYTDEIEPEKGSGQISFHTDGLHSYKHYAKINSVFGDQSIRDSTYLISITKEINNNLTSNTNSTLDTLIISSTVPINHNLDKLQTHQITFEDICESIYSDCTKIYISKPGELTFFDGYHTPTRNMCTTRKRRQVIRIMFSDICFTPRLEYRPPGNVWSIEKILFAIFVFCLIFFHKIFIIGYFVLSFIWGEVQPGVYKKMSPLEIEINKLRLSRFEAYNFDTNKIELLMNPYTLQSHDPESIKYGMVKTSQHSFVVYVLLGYFPQNNSDSKFEPISNELLQILSDIIFASPSDKILFQKYIKTLRKSIIDKVRNIIKHKLTEIPVHSNSNNNLNKCLRTCSEPYNIEKSNLDNLREILTSLQKESQKIV